MTEPTIVQGMSKDDEKRLDDIFSQIYCKAENNNMRFMEFMQLLFDKELINAKFDLQFYLNLYEEHFALEEIIIKTKKSTKKQVKEDTTNKFSRSKFLRLIDSLGKIMYHGQKKYLQNIIQDIFQDNKKRQEVRVMAYDDVNKRLLGENTIKMLISFEEYFQGLFTQYQPENYYKSEQMLEWNEVRLMNLRMPIVMLMQLLFDAAVIPVHYSLENFEDLCVRILPAISVKENQFYQSNSISQSYDQIVNQKFKYKEFTGDPKISYIDFYFMLARIGLEIAMKEQKIDSKKDPTQVVKQWLNSIGIGVGGEHFGRHMQLLKERGSQKDSRQLTTKEITQSSESDDVKWQNYLIYTSKGEPLEIKEIYSFFLHDFPPLPQLTTSKDLTKQFVKSIEDKKAKEELAKKLEEDKKNKNKPAPKPVQKKGENVVKYQWEPMDAPERKCSYQYFLDFVAKTCKINQFRDVNEIATFSHIQAAPVLLPECLYPIDPPQPVRQLIEASMMSFAEQSYFQALKNLNAAQELWSQRGDLHDSEMIFFEYFGGQIYEIAGQDAAALNKFLRVKAHADKLYSDHPDKALPYCGFGSVLYHMQEYELSVRAFMKARLLREQSIGDENIENALIFNNLGCALHQMGEWLSAETCYLFAIAIFDMHLGPMDAMTMNAKRNLNQYQQQLMKRVKSAHQRRPLTGIPQVQSYTSYSSPLFQRVTTRLVIIRKLFIQKCRELSIQLHPDQMVRFIDKVQQQCQQDTVNLSELSLPGTCIPLIQQLIRENPFVNLQLNPLADSVGNIKLTMVSLTLFNCGIGPKGFAHLFHQVAQSQTLQALLVGNPYQQDRNRLGLAIDSLAEALEQNEILSILDISGCGISDPDRLNAALARNQSLIHINLGDNDLKNVIIVPSNMEVIELYRNPLGQNAIQICEQLNPHIRHHCIVRELNLKDCKITLLQLHALLEFIQKSTYLAKLILDNNPLQGENCLCISSYLAFNNKLQYLSLRGCDLTTTFIVQLASGLAKNTKLMSLDISKNKIDKEAVQALADAIAVNPYLRELKVKKCQLNDEVSVELFKVLMRSRIESYEFSQNMLADQTALYGIQLLRKHQKILKFGFEKNINSYETQKQLRHYLSENQRQYQNHLMPTLLETVEGMSNFKEQHSQNDKRKEELQEKRENAENELQRSQKLLQEGIRIAKEKTSNTEQKLTKVKEELVVLQKLAIELDKSQWAQTLQMDEETNQLSIDIKNEYQNIATLNKNIQNDQTKQKNLLTYYKQSTDSLLMQNDIASRRFKQAQQEMLSLQKQLEQMKNPVPVTKKQKK